MKNFRINPVYTHSGLQFVLYRRGNEIVFPHGESAFSLVAISISRRIKEQLIGRDTGSQY